MDAIKRIDQLMAERNWTDYKLSIESGLSSSTIANIHRRNTIPSIATLEAICHAFGISLSQFFADENNNIVQLSDEQYSFFKKWTTLTNDQKQILYALINEFK
ncbi:MAG: helix-turn-helix transcriptional regulator [Acetatifactor sp.]|nr:helix-turn-helix transcriptional regulator [Acetatifactor sp.]